MTFVTDLDDITDTDLAQVGGKAANLAQLRGIDGIRVPDGFCVTVAAYEHSVTQHPAVAALHDRLTRDDTQRDVAEQLRATIARVPIPAEVTAAIHSAVAHHGPDVAFAVRSSATTEDSAGASFAGQHDSFLGVVGPEAVLETVRRCWASLFSDRAVAYRQHKHIDHRDARMAVVVQRLVAADVSGVLFTADPLTGNRTVSSVEATWGLGEELVSGHVSGDVYRLRGDGTVEASPADPARPALQDDSVRELAELGRRVESHFDRPQDIEWCLNTDGFSIVQSRPITTLFPVPNTDDNENHVYLSVGHQQMMTDAMRRLGLSFWQMTTPAPMAEAGGRLFVDVTRRIASPAGRSALLEMIGKADPLTVDAIQTVLGRDGFVLPLPDPPAPAIRDAPQPLQPDPAIVTDLIAGTEASVTRAREEIATHTGAALFDFIRSDMQELRRVLFDPRAHQVYTAAMDATWWLNENLQSWLGERNAGDTLSLSVPHNITSQMGLALLDVADVIRPHGDVVRFLQQVDGEDIGGGFLDDLPALDGGAEVRSAIVDWLDRFGMRCAGEIDITRARWSEQPAALLPTLLTNVRNFAPGEAGRRFARGLDEARQKEQDVLDRLRSLPDGEQKAQQTKDMIDVVRTFIGFREYPKYGMVCRYLVYKQAMMKEADILVRDGVLRDRSDVFHLTFDEFDAVVRTGRADADLIARRRAEFHAFETLTPPRVLTSDGEAINGSLHRNDTPAGALLGLPVSSGVVEGRARVVTDMASADLDTGDILVTAFTDPSWTPLFLTAAGLVTEVGGLMTHGAVVAREYGLPAVVGVERATQLIRDGQRIRVDGTSGHVELLDPDHHTS